jgi:anti-anti-sigma factor
VNVRIEAIGSSTLVIAEGRLDFGTAGAFEQQLQQALTGAGAAPAALIVDCAKLDYVSSAGLRAILLTARASQKAGITFALCALTPAVREVFDLSGFSRILVVHADRAAALAAVVHK